MNMEEEMNEVTLLPDYSDGISEELDEEGIWGENTEEYKERFKNVSQGEIFEEELLGRIFRINLKNVVRHNNGAYVYSNCLTMSIQLFKFENDIVKSNVLVCEIPLSTIVYKRENEEKDWINGLLEHEYICGFNGFVGKLVRVKVRDIINENLLQSRVDIIEFLDDYKETGFLFMSGDCPNTQSQWIGRLFRWSNENKIKLTPLTWEEGRQYLTCCIGELPQVTGNELAEIVGEPIEGKCDKEQYSWIIKMDLFNDNNELYTSYAYEIYDYKNYDQLKMDDMYAYHLGGGVKIDGQPERDALDYFIAYMYNEVLKIRNRPC